jgi:dihydroorotate dehydrogenase (NAD+) catalytic subunit
LRYPQAGRYAWPSPVLKWLKMSATVAVDLSVQIGALRLANPVLAASGTFGYGIEFAHLVDLNRLGGIVVKGLSLESLEGAPAPRLVESAGGMINAVGLQNVGVRAFVRDKLPALRAYRTAIVANVFGHTVNEYAEVIRVLNDAEGVAAYELNISCPNTDAGGAYFGTDLTLTAHVVAASCKASKRPVWAKLSPNVTDITAIAKAAADAGAAALTVANTYPAMSVDFRSGRSRLGRVSGGLSGPAIKPITQKLVYETAQAVKIPIIGLGGIETAEDVLEYLTLGATAVQVGTAHFSSPKVSVHLLDELEKLLISNKVINISNLRGSFKADWPSKNEPVVL